ncbi:MAG: ribosome biosis GTPase / thiamine phosphate phosphatase [Frankiaceae bacterium]|nr:ribosome biosis GTPase / thiamine phosphate phosphatase [Frankiaceae bacterium]
MVTVDRGRYGCLLADGTLAVTMRARELGRRSVVVGDSVAVVGDVSGGPDALARIVRVDDRRSVLRRTADDEDPQERIVVANADQLVVVCSVATPEPQPRLVDRCLAAAYDAGVDPILCLTKVDLGPAEPVRAIYRPLDIPVVESGAESRDDAAQQLRELMAGRVTVFVGSSGVGKSTLVNVVVPDAAQRVNVISTATGKGMHTTTAAIALALPDGESWVVDTPGIRSFGLAHIDSVRLVTCFPDISPGTAECPTDCDHLDREVCTLDAWVAAGHAHPERLDSLRRLLVQRSTVPPVRQ